MATKLNAPNARAVTRETAFAHHGRVVLITLTEGGKLIRFRESRMKTVYTLTIEQAFWMAVQNKTAEQKAAKDAERKAKRLEKKARES